ncbi:MAG: response regulator [Candidatus Eisenbacteria bacterium]|uniref:Response regulator n=1 Tax=Eiseniibacteriota bacterium TaxID=2212470 RepID=A0A956LYD8_UNCEI|nr:response regulator [Candidatus Eisenbacteria bacterium]
MQALVVDDSRTMRVILRGILGELGYTVTEASDGQDALNKMRQENGLPGFVLLDWNMPVMNGYECLIEMRKNPALADVPVMMVTTEGEQEAVVKALMAGANEYLMKPFTKEMIAEKLQMMGLKAA